MKYSQCVCVKRTKNLNLSLSCNLHFLSSLLSRFFFFFLFIAYIHFIVLSFIHIWWLYTYEHRIESERKSHMILFINKILKWKIVWVVCYYLIKKLFLHASPTFSPNEKNIKIHACTFNQIIYIFCDKLRE